MSVQATWNHLQGMFQSPNPQWPLVTLDRTYMAQLVTSESRWAHNSNLIKVTVSRTHTQIFLSVITLKADKTPQQRRFTAREKKNKNRWKQGGIDHTQREKGGCDATPFHLLSRGHALDIVGLTPLRGPIYRICYTPTQTGFWLWSFQPFKSALRWTDWKCKGIWVLELSLTHTCLYFYLSGDFHMHDAFPSS